MIKATFAALFAALSVLGGAARGNGDAGAKYKAYEFKDQGFTLTAPAAWESADFDKTQSPHMLAILRPNVHVAEGLILPTMTIIVNADNVIDERNLPDAVRGYRKQQARQIPDVKFEDDQEVTIDGAKGTRISYAGTGDKLLRQGSTILIIRHGKLYVIGWFADPDTFANVGPAFQKAMDSLKWTD
jgi:hypothetical protein